MAKRRFSNPAQLGMMALFGDADRPLLSEGEARRLAAEIAESVMKMESLPADQTPAEDFTAEFGNPSRAALDGTPEFIPVPAEELLADWYAPLNSFRSRGSLAPRPGGLAGLAAARQQTLSQFFTPNAVVRLMWGLLEPAMSRPVGSAYSYAPPRERRGRLAIFDNSFGSGRMFQLADPAKHYLCGIELDEECVEAVRETALAAGFEFMLEQGSMEEFRPAQGRGYRSRFHVALINPPFSIKLDNQFTEPFETGSYGKYGPKSSHISHRYALHQALACAGVVVAVVPRSFVREIEEPESPFFDRLLNIYHLPSGSFREEKTEVDVSLVLFAPREVAAEHKKTFVLKSLELEEKHFPGEEFISFPDGEYSCPDVPRAEMEQSAATVKLPYTGIKTVKLSHVGRELKLEFQCGAAEAKVWNRILVGRMPQRSGKDNRIPQGVRFTGQGKLDLMNYLVQPDPVREFSNFVAQIRDWGFEPEVEPALWSWLRRQTRRRDLLCTPLRHVAYKKARPSSAVQTVDQWLDQQTEAFTVTVKERLITQEACAPYRGYGQGVKEKALEVGAERTVYIVPGQTGTGPEKFWVHLKEGEYDSELDEFSQLHVIDRETLLKHFELPAEAAVFADGSFAPAQAEGWVEVHPGLKAAFPREYARMEKRARRLGLDKWLTWGYQFNDLVEVALRRGNTIIGWEMGLGKARLSLALCYLAGPLRKTLLVVEARLIDEMRREVAKLGIPADEWQVVEGMSEAQNLRRINIIAYSKLRTADDESQPGTRHYPIAEAMRGHIHTMVIDECHNIKNRDADQTKAVWAVEAKERYGLSGTAIDNYPRDILPLMQWAAGDGVPWQRYGDVRPYLDDRNLQNMYYAERGVDRFREMFVTVEWVTHEFEDGMVSGAKREIPKIKDLDAFREMVAPIVKRRVMSEPDVAQFIRIPEKTEKIVSLPWKRDHLERYVRVSDMFCQWYKDLKEKAGHDRQKLGLIAILAKIQAVVEAVNYPQEPAKVKASARDAATKIEPAYDGLTSKQEYAIRRLKEWAAAGDKVIFLAQSPKLLNMMARLLEAEGIKAVVFHGEISISKRVKAMDKEFREGDAQVLLGSKGCLQTGYNIYQANRVMFYDRAWSHKVEWQAAARALRPQQERTVEIEFLQIEGSVDDYMQQMVDFKATTSRAGLDWGEDDLDPADFLHIESILDRFVDDYEAKYGADLRGRKKAAQSVEMDSPALELAA